MTADQCACRQAERDNLVSELVKALKEARQWMNGDKWRYDDDPVRRQCWRDQVDAMDALLARAKARASDADSA